jgi:WD40 repeat protein/DNA-binding SARP family transcriptional activator
VDFRILGPLEVRREQAVVSLGGPKQRAVLAVLLLRANEPVSAEQLAQALWGEDAPASAVRTVQVHVSRLRKALGDGDVVMTTPAGYRLRVEPGELDAERFERLVDDGRRALRDGRPDEAAGVVGKALTLWRGPPLADLAFERFAQRDIEQLEEQRLAAIEVRMEAGLAAGRHAELVADLRRLVAEHPTSERLAGLLMLALYRSGRQAEALDAYHDARRKLADEIGIEPGPELRDLQAAVLRHDPSLRLPAPVELPRELDPVAAPALAGRDHELAWLRDRWRAARGGTGAVVALAGPRGIGRTRLAAELAQEAHGEGARVLYASGAAAIGALGGAGDDTRPALIVADDADAAPASLRALAQGPTLVLAIAEQLEVLSAVKPDAALTLEPLDEEDVRAIALTYVRDHRAEDVPARALLHASGGIPRRVHEVARTWARGEAARRVEAVAGPAAAGRAELRSLEEQLAGGIVQLQSTRELVRRAGEDEGRVICPFKGLASFEADDAPFFFGRERLIAELVARLVGAPLLGVVGPSGSGKSSVVKAGLMPALASGVLPGSEHWPQAVIRPGERPLRELHAGLDELAAGRRVVLAVDQFEEAFTMCRDEEERAEFFAELVRLPRDRRGSVVILTIRADFYGRCAAYPELSRLLAANHVLVGSLDRDELREAVICPAERAGLGVEPELADALVNDVADEPGALPLLSTALLELWHRRDGRRLRVAAYEETGRVRGAVARLAEGAFGRLDEAQQAIARGVLLRLAEIDEDGNVERRRLPLEELEAEEGAVGDVIGLLADNRLLTVSEGSVEVAHEALLREWPRLRAWIEEDRDGLRIRRGLTAAAEEWRELGYDEDMLYRGLRLTEADEWREGHELSLSQLERTFLDASDERRARERKARRRIVQRAFAGLALALVAIAAVAIVALYQGREAERQRDIAVSRGIAASAASALSTDPALSLSLATRALDVAETSEAAGVLRQATLGVRTLAVLPAHKGWAYSAAFGPGGWTAVSAGDDGRVRLWDLRGRRPLGTLIDGRAVIYDANFDPDGRFVAVAADNGVLSVVGVEGGQPREVLEVPRQAASSAAFSPDGKSVVGAFSDGTVRIAGIEPGGSERVLTGHQGFVYGAEFSSDGERVLSWSEDGTLRVWDVASGSTLAVLRGHDGNVVSGGFSPDGTEIVSAGYDATVRIWDAASGEQLRRFDAEYGPFVVSFSPDGRRIAVGGEDGAVRVLDASDPRAPELAVLRRHGAAVSDARFSPDGRRLLSAGQDGVLRLWDPGAALVLRADVKDAKFAPDGRILGARADGSVSIWSAVAGPLEQSLKGGRRPATAVAASSDGRRIASGDEEGVVRVWQLHGERAPLTLRGHTTRVSSLAFSPDGRRLVSAGDDGRVNLWAPSERRPLQLWRHDRSVYDVAFAPDGRRIVAAGEGGALTIRAADADRPGIELRGHSGAVFSAAFAPDGSTVASGGADGTVRLWSAEGEPLATMRGHEGPVESVEFRGDGRRLVTAGTDGTVRVWDPGSREALVVLHDHRGQAFEASFDRDGRRVLSAGDDGTIWVAPCEVCGSLAEVLDVAHARAQRLLTPAERERFLPPEE